MDCKSNKFANMNYKNSLQNDKKKDISTFL